MRIATELFLEPRSVRKRLEEIGTEIRILEDVQRAWGVAEASATPFEPAAAPGTKGWIGATGTLRQQQVELKGWTAENVRNWPIVVRGDDEIALTVTSGDSLTGQPYEHIQPSTKNPKGAVVADAVNANGVQLDLGELITRSGQLRLIRPNRVKATQALVYFVLVHCTDSHVWTEVSLPAQLEGKYIRRWKERIILPPLERLAPPPVSSTHDAETETVIDVPVSRK